MASTVGRLARSGRASRSGWLWRARRAGPQPRLSTAGRTSGAPSPAVPLVHTGEAESSKARLFGCPDVRAVRPAGHRVSPARRRVRSNCATAPARWGLGHRTVRGRARADLCVGDFAAERAAAGGHEDDLDCCSDPSTTGSGSGSSWVNYWQGRDEQLWVGIDEDDPHPGLLAVGRVSGLRAALASARPVLTAELGPPRDADPDGVLRMCRDVARLGGRGQRDRQPGGPTSGCRAWPPACWPYGRDSSR